MKRNVIAILIVVNTLLAGLLVYRYIQPNVAMAQVRQPGNYVLISGTANGVSGDLVYVLDIANGELSAMIPNQHDKVEAMTPINLNQVFDNAMQSKPAPDGKNR